MTNPKSQTVACRIASFHLRLAVCMSLIFLMLAVTAHGQKSEAKAVDAILGVKVGMTAHEADEALEKVGNHPEGEAGEAEDGESKEAWNIRGTDYSTVVIMRGKDGLVRWVSGFVRPGREVAFASFGDLKTAARSDANRAVWNVKNALGGYKIVVKGGNGKATVVYLISLASPQVE